MSCGKEIFVKFWKSFGLVFQTWNPVFTLANVCAVRIFLLCIIWCTLDSMCRCITLHDRVVLCSVKKKFGLV